MLKSQAFGSSTDPSDATNGGSNKENQVNPSEKVKTPRTGLKMAHGMNSGNVSPAASPSSKKMRLMKDRAKPLATPSLKPTGLRDITNSSVKAKVQPRIESTASVAPHLLNSKKRPLSAVKAHAAAPPSKLHIMNTASQLDFSSMPDSELPEVEVAPDVPKRECSDEDDFFEQFDFSFLTHAPLEERETDEELVEQAKAHFESNQFASELSQLSIDNYDDKKQRTQGTI